MAEARGNRTHRRRFRLPTGFEVRGGHQRPIRFRPPGIRFPALPADNTPSADFRGRRKESAMRRSLLVVTVAAGCLLLAGSAFAASGFEVGVRGAYWFPKLTGSAQTNATGDTRFDFKDTLGVGDENVPFGEA